MGLVIESEAWEPNQLLYLFMLISCFLSISFLPRRPTNSNNRAPTLLDQSLPSSSSSFLRFQRRFLLLYSLSSGQHSVFVRSFWYELLLNSQWEEKYRISTASTARVLKGTRRTEAPWPPGALARGDARHVHAPHESKAQFVENI